MILGIFRMKAFYCYLSCSLFQHLKASDVTERRQCSVSSLCPRDSILIILSVSEASVHFRRNVTEAAPARRPRQPRSAQY